MAPLSDAPSRTTSEESLYGKMPYEARLPNKMQHSPQKQPDKPPVTEDSLWGMPAELHRNITADVG
ncbi:Hypothetical predicted protein [Pelobates cultripes]|uniref:Uncharacterized protein n=1 Tax=Pelobates cultripes TaxID=61616 RepID=A0AAD1R654_PELCU|nr:Hypothetical predicted protein [Pelobates cultripes]